MNIVMLPTAFPLLAQATEGAAAAAPTEPMSLATIIASVLGTLITMFLIPYLNKQRLAAEAAAAKFASEKTKSDIEGRGVLLQRVKAYLFGAAAAIAEKEFPKLAADIISGKLKEKGAIKSVLRSWGALLRDEAVEYFQGQGINLIAAVGDSALDRLIERAANAVSPFPGKDTAVALLKDKVSNTLIDKGISWVRGRIERDGNIIDSELSE